MKKLKVLGVAAAAVGMISLTSCLGDGKKHLDGLWPRGCGVQHGRIWQRCDGRLRNGSLFARLRRAECGRLCGLHRYD